MRQGNGIVWGTLLYCIIAAPIAAEELSWKWKPGDAWLVTHTGETTSTTTVNGKTTKDRLQTLVDVLWSIDEETAGKVIVTQQIKRLKLTANSEVGNDILYDSNDTEKPTGPAAIVATAMQPLLQVKLKCEVNSQGEVKHLSGAEQITSANKSNEWILGLLEQPLAYLPGKDVKVNDTWQRTRTLDLPLGQFEQTQDYRLVAVDEANSTAEIKASLSMKHKLGSSKTVVKEQDIQGTLQFDTAAGCLREAETTQRMTTVTPYRGGEIVVKTNSTNRTVLKKL